MDSVPEYEVRHLVGHYAGHVFVVWTDEAYPASWEPVENFFNHDASNKVVSVNAHLLNYQMKYGVSLIPACYSWQRN